MFRLKADDGSIVVGRSMEFAVDLKYDAIVVPRNKAYVSPAPDGKEGLSWKTRYGYVGIASFGMEYGLSDGMNEKGLAVGLLWFESDMKWQDVAPGEMKRALAQGMVGDWILGNFVKRGGCKAGNPEREGVQLYGPEDKNVPDRAFYRL